MPQTRRESTFEPFRPMQHRIYASSSASNYFVSAEIKLKFI